MCYFVFSTQGGANGKPVRLSGDALWDADVYRWPFSTSIETLPRETLRAKHRVRLFWYNNLRRASRLLRSFRDILDDCTRCCGIRSIGDHHIPIRYLRTPMVVIHRRLKKGRYNIVIPQTASSLLGGKAVFLF